MQDDSRRLITWLSCTCLALGALSCGAASQVSEQNPAPAASVGDEPPPSAAEAKAAPEQRALPVKSGHGRLVVRTEVAGKPAPAHAKLLDDERSIDFEPGEEISVEAGTRHIEVTLADDSMLVDKPTQQLDVFVEAHQRADVNAAFPWAEVQLNLLVNGRPQPATRVKLVRNGKAVAEVKTGAPMFRISPGTYEAEVLLHGKTLRVKGLVFFESSAQIIPVRAQQ